jgi:hypothetical protein
MLASLNSEGATDEDTVDKSHFFSPFSVLFQYALKAASR